MRQEKKLVCDISTRAQKRIAGAWADVDMRPVFTDSGYALFGFLANIRNYSAIPPLSAPRGLPDGFELAPYDEAGAYPPSGYLGEHSFSWVTIEELLAFDYNQLIEDRRVNGQAERERYGGITAPAGEGRIMTYRDFLGAAYFADLHDLQQQGVERVVFGFDE